MYGILVAGLLLLASRTEGLTLKFGLGFDNAETRNADADVLFSEYWESMLVNDPESATMYGDHRFDDKLTRYDLAYQQETKTRLEGFLERAKAILTTASDDSQLQFNLELLIKTLEYRIGLLNVKSYLVPVTLMINPPMSLSMLLEYIKPKDAKDYRNLIARYRAIPEQINQIIDLFKEGIRTNFTLNENAMWKGTGFETALVEESPFYEPFKTIPNLPPEEVEAIQNEAKDAIQNSVVPAYKKLAKFLADEYSQHTRPSAGVGSLPNGLEYYRAQLAFHLTDSTVTPDQIHQMGIQEVERLTKEMKNVITALGFTMTPSEFSDSLRKDKSQFFTTKQEALDAYKTTLFNVITPKLPQFFKKIPKMELKIQEVPPEQAGGAVAYYMLPSPDGSTPGIFYVDTSDPTNLARFEVVTTALHEGLPGHHFQISYGMEMENVPDFRKYDTASNAYVEGWGLYAETLGFEMGLYEDNYMKYGHLSQSIFRACRLVVDTGMHALGWTREQAIEYMLQHSASTRKTVEREVDRYIAMPAQACSYKFGELKIKELRKKAEDKLGDKFDVREFHDVILRSAGPLELVAKEVDRYIAANCGGC